MMKCEAWRSMRSDTNKYTYTCQVCGKSFCGLYKRNGIYVGNCFGRVTKDNFANERQRFWESELNIADVKKKGAEEYEVSKLLPQIDTLVKEKCAGVWALWANYKTEDAKCIQVAKNKNIFLEIKNDFIKGKGSLDYKKYEKNGTIIIVSKGNSDFAVEAQYAHDFKAEEWCLNFSEAHQLGVLKGLYQN